MQPNCTARSLMVTSFFFPKRHSIVLEAWMYAFLVIPERRIATFYKQGRRGELMYKFPLYGSCKLEGVKETKKN